MIYTEVSKLKVSVVNEKTRHVLSHAKIHWCIIPENIKNKTEYFKYYKNFETDLTVDVTNHAGFSILWGSLHNISHVWFYIHKVLCSGFQDACIERKFSVKGGIEREIIITLSPE